MQENVEQLMVSHSDEALTAVWDYSASPYALGDTLTWSMLSGVAALNAGKKCFDVCVITHKRNPCCIHQRYITPQNYHGFLLDVLPAFFVNPLMRDFHLYQDRESMETEVFFKHISGQAMFPDFKEHIGAFRKGYGLYNSHETINAFHAEHGFIPRLQVPMGHEGWAKRFFTNYRPKTVFVCIHLRNRGVHTDQSVAEPYRDGKFEDWMALIDHAREKYPEIMFVVLGRPLEWPRDLFRKSNVLILKSLGYGLVEELAMIHECDLFMATNSGPAVMAIFGDKPYLIFQPEQNSPYTAQVYGVNIGDDRLPFAEPHQNIVWGNLTRELLFTEFEKKYNELSEINGWGQD
jgi:hypothetical protein